MLIILSVLAVLLASIFWIRSRAKAPPQGLKSIRELPGPHKTGHWLWGNGNDFKKNRSLPHLTIKDWMEEYGDMCSFSVIFGRQIVLLNDPQLIKAIWVDNIKKYGKSSNLRAIFKDAVGDGILVSNGAVHRRNRRIMNKAFHATALEGYVHMMIDCTERLLRKWDSLSLPKQQQQPSIIDVAVEFQNVTLDIIGITGFGYDIEAVEKSDSKFGAAVEGMLLGIEAMFISPIGAPVRYLPSQMFRRYWYGVDYISKTVRDIVQHEKQQFLQNQQNEQEPPQQPKNLLQLLLSAVDEETGETLSEREICEEIKTLMLAGHETTAVSLTWMFYLISQHPEVERRLLEEVDAVLPDLKPPTYQDYNQMKYLRCVMKESLRLYPPATSSTLRAYEDGSLDGYFIPKGTTIMYSQYAVHHNPRWWPDPEAFKPERFEEERELVPYSWLPFSLGARNCIGLNFAQLEMAVIASMILQRYRLIHDPTHEVEMNRNVTLRPRYGMKMILEPRVQSKAPSF